MRQISTLSISALTAALAIVSHPGEAKACGGCFHNPTDNPSVVTDHRMVLTIAQDQTTLYDQVQYQGDPKSFAWVLPIHGSVKVGLSADVVFSALDRATQTQVRQPVLNCPARPVCPNDTLDKAPSAGSLSDASTNSPDSGVTVISEQVVGPYETVQLSANDPAALEMWLTKNGFVVPADVQPIVAAYQKEGFDFLAMKLLPGQGIQSMRPVRITTPGASIMLPLRMVSAGTGAKVGITLWVIADGRYEPANFPEFIIKDEELIWDWQTKMSNYRTVRAEKEAASKNQAWELESSMTLGQFQIQNPIRFRLDPMQDYQPVTGPNPETAQQVRDEDIATLFHGQSQAPRVTRLRADLSHASLAQDLSLTASQDQTAISNMRNVARDVNRPPCPTFPPCPGFEGFNGFGGAGCAVDSNGSVAGDAFMLGGLGFVGIALARRRRRNKQA